jgi:hypothetical protein
MGCPPMWPSSSARAGIWAAARSWRAQAAGVGAHAGVPGLWSTKSRRVTVAEQVAEVNGQLIPGLPKTDAGRGALTPSRHGRHCIG